MERRAAYPSLRQLSFLLSFQRGISYGFFCIFVTMLSSYRDIDIAILSVRPSVRYVPVFWQTATDTAIVSTEGE